MAGRQGENQGKDGKFTHAVTPVEHRPTAPVPPVTGGVDWAVVAAGMDDGDREFSATHSSDDGDVAGVGDARAGEAAASIWFRQHDEGNVDVLVAAGLTPVGRNGEVDGEAVIRYRTSSGELIDVCIEDYGDSSCPRVVTVDPDDRRSMSTRSDVDGVDLSTWVERHGHVGDGDPEEIADAARELSWSVGHFERAVGRDALIAERGF